MGAADVVFQQHALAGATLYAVLRRKRDGYVWRADSSAWEAFNSSHWWNNGGASYAVAMTGDASGLFTAPMPGAITEAEDVYPVAWLQAGANPALAADSDVGVGEVAWNGANSVDLTLIGTNAADSSNAVTAQQSIAAIELQTNKISSNNTTLLGSFANGHLSIVVGDDVTTASGKAIAIPRPAGATWPADLTAYTVTLKCQAKADLTAAGTKSFTNVLSVTLPASSQTLNVNNLTNATTSGLAPGANEWTFAIVATNGSLTNTLMSGSMSVLSVP